MDNLEPDMAAREIGRLLTIIATALAAMDRGEYGDVRRILKTGRAEPVKPTTSLFGRGGAA